MQQADIALVTAFVAGFASFISPCVLPLVPAYLSFMSGVSIADLRAGRRDPSQVRAVFLSSLAFVIGLSTVFMLLGASASAFGQAIQRWMPIFAKIAGVIVVILGIHMTGLVRIPFLAYERRFQAGSNRAGIATAFVMGLAFAFGWTPCIGPILGGIIALATQENVPRGILLLAIYSLGLGIPFLLAGLFLNAFYGFFGRIQRHFHKIEVVAGIILILVGVALIFNFFEVISGKFADWLGTGVYG
jgi:cytochrome c-type biogenesis protein